jgi:lipopolysaccharide heptosyltransferase I
MPVFLPSSPRILIVRLSAIGDVIHTIPLLNALRDRLPEASISWVVQKPASVLLDGHPSLDELIETRRGFLKSPREVWRLRRRLRQNRYDLVIDAQGLTKSALLGWLSGAPRRIGYGGQWGREMSRWFNNEPVHTNAPHAVDRMLQLLSPLGIESPRVRFSIPESPVDRLWVETVIRETELGSGFAVVHPGAGWPSKRWPLDRFAAVTRYLGSHRGLPTMVVWGSPVEREMARRIVAGSQGYAHLAPPRTLRELAALSRRARLFVGSDSGPLHLAAAVETPCVGLYGPWPAERHGPYGLGHVVVQKMTMFHGTTRERRYASTEYMEAIDVPSVCQACNQVLDTGTRNTAA